MNCFFCKGDIEEGKLNTYMVDLGNCIIIIKKVPARECNQCGAVSYNHDVAIQLEKIVNSMRNSMMEIAVVNYSDKVVA